MIIADRTAYGVPAEVFKEMSTSIGRIFQLEEVQNWIAEGKSISVPAESKTNIPFMLS